MLKTTHKKTKLYQETYRQTEEFKNMMVIKIEKWSLFHNKLEVKDYYGNRCYFEGIDYGKTQEKVFWNFFPPFFKGEIPKILKNIEQICIQKKLKNEEYLLEACELLKNVVSTLWNKIAETDQKLKCNGIPKKEFLKDISFQINNYHKYIEKEYETITYSSDKIKFKKDKEITLNKKKYKLIKLLGEGGNSVVWEIENYNKERFALKFLNKVNEDSEKIKRFKTEQKISNELKHKNIVKIKEIGIYIENGIEIHFSILPLYKYSLKSYLKEKEVIEKEKLEIIKNILEGINFTHKNDIHHRDLKPENILINNLNDIVIADFGIADVSNNSNFLDNNTGKTDRMCNFLYASPEQKGKDNSKVSNKCDIYSLGLIINEMFTKNIINGVNFYKIADKYKKNESNLEFLDYIVDNMIKYNIEERFDIEKTLIEFNKFLALININTDFIPDYFNLSFKEYLNIKKESFSSKHFINKYKEKHSITTQKLFIHSCESKVINETYEDIMKVYDNCSALEFDSVDFVDSDNFKIVILVHYDANTKAMDIFEVRNKTMNKKSLTEGLLFSKYPPKLYKKENIEGLFIDIFNFDIDLEKEIYYKNVYYLYKNNVFFLNKVILTKDLFSKVYK